MFSKNLFNKEDLNVRVSIYGKNPKYYMLEAYKEGWIRKICEALDESDACTPSSTNNYHVVKYNDDCYTFRSSTNYIVKLFDDGILVYSETLSNILGNELISFINEKVKVPRTIRIDSDYCSWIILIPN